eukprot:1158557-Pelagomonas_calceolata.AAC.7
MLLHRHATAGGMSAHRCMRLDGHTLDTLQMRFLQMHAHKCRCMHTNAVPPDACTQMQMHAHKCGSSRCMHTIASLMQSVATSPFFI